MCWKNLNHFPTAYGQFVEMYGPHFWEFEYFVNWKSGIKYENMFTCNEKI